MSSSSNLLVFQVDPDLLFDSADRAKLAVMTGMLSIPWYMDGLIPGIPFLRYPKVSDFQAQLCAWPAGPGTISVTIATRQMFRRAQGFTSHNFHLASTREGGEARMNEVSSCNGKV